MLVGDLHLSSKAPKRRRDEDYLQTQFGKLTQIRDLYDKHKCDLLIQTGDFFDSYAGSKSLIATVLEYFRHVWDGVKIYCIFGQHDIHGHSFTTYPNSPLRILEAGGVLGVLNGELALPGLNLVGAGFGDEPVSGCECILCFKILVVHKLICPKPQWPGHNPVTPSVYLKKYAKFDLIVCGDYHYRFVESLRGERHIINPGCLVRKKLDDKDHEPGVVIYDTKEKTVCVEILDYNKNALDLTPEVKSELIEPDYESLYTFISSVISADCGKVGWLEILTALYEKQQVPSKVRDLISEAIKEAKGEYTESIESS
jgi:DNA repair exonuclease SbcCD nuclease subunit